MTIVVVPRDRHHDRPHKEGNNMSGPLHFLPTLLMNRMGRVGMGGDVAAPPTANPALEQFSKLASFGTTRDLTVHY